MRKAEVYYGNALAGILTEGDEGEFLFKYDEDYVEQYPDQPITFTMPVRSVKYTDKRLFPFFEGLIPEGWLLDIAEKSRKVKQDDRMGLLMACCGDCIGAVSVKPLPKEHE